MSASPTVYFDLDAVTFIFGGIPIEGAKGEGGFLEIEADEPSFVAVKGADGSITRSKTGNVLYHISVFCSQKSRINTILSTFLITDQSTQNGGGVVPLAIKDLGSFDLYVSPRAWVVGFPKVAYGKQGVDRQWVIDAEIPIVALGT